MAKSKSAPKKEAPNAKAKAKKETVLEAPVLPKVETPVTPIQEQQPSKPDLPKCGPNERLFESPDGRIYKGPRDMSSIPDPLHDGIEINQRR